MSEIRPDSIANEGQRRGATYREAGVDIDAATSAVDRIKALAHATFAAPDAAAPIGHFGGVYRIAAGSERLLVASADGVGTKLMLAFVLGGEAHARVGADLVNHCVNDVLACGATPLFFLDYIAMGRLDGAVLEAVVRGMATACRENGLALIGGETAEMPGLYRPGEYDVAGFIVGEVAPEAFVDGRAVQEGDALIGLPATGLHTNGYSLARHILGLTGDAASDRAILDRPLPGGGGETIGEALMRPHPSYFSKVMPLVQDGLVRGMAHITGGGLIDNVPRMLPDGLAAWIDPSTWTANPIFTYLVEAGSVPQAERYRALNMGIGFVLAVPADRAREALEALPGAVEIGRVVAADGEGLPRVRGLADTTDGTVDV